MVTECDTLYARWVVGGVHCVIIMLLKAGVAGCGAKPGTLTIIPDHRGGGVYQRLDRSSWLDMVGVVGGVLAVFTGFSVISGFELFYWLTVRLWEQIRKDKVGVTTYIVQVEQSQHHAV